MDSTTTSTARPERPVAIVCVGLAGPFITEITVAFVLANNCAGSGKTTLMQQIYSYLHKKQQPPYMVNLDPAVTNLQYQPNIDIRDSVNYKKVMEEYGLGPNGGIMTSLNLFTTKVDQVINILEKRAVPDPEKPDRKPIQNILIDTPGQIEVFLWSASGTIMLESLAASFPTVLAYVVDTARTTSTATFMSNMLYACSILYRMKLPMIVVFNKTDVQDAEFAKKWMADYEAFREALTADENNNAFGGVEGSGFGTGYMSSLVDSMALALEEFYTGLNVVSVSALKGTGMDELFEAVKEKVVEFEQGYQPELDRRRAQRDEDKKKQREKELEKMMKGMSMGSTASSSVLGDMVSKEDDDVELPSSDEAEDDDFDDEDDREGLQARYEAAMRDQQDSTGADASFAKYLHTQRH
jgi:GTPase SAR1 family protein